MSQREYWSEAMEKRYKRRRLELWPKLPLKGHFFFFFKDVFFQFLTIPFTYEFIYSGKATQFEKNLPF